MRFKAERKTAIRKISYKHLEFSCQMAQDFIKKNCLKLKIKFLQYLKYWYYRQKFNILLLGNKELIPFLI